MKKNFKKNSNIFNFVVINGILGIIFFFFYKWLVKKYNNWELFYENMSLPFDYFKNDLNMIHILKLSKKLYNDLNEFRKLSEIYKYKNINLLLEEQHYNGYNGSYVWDLLSKNCKNKIINKYCILLEGYKFLVTMQIGINYKGYINLEFLKNKIYNKFNNNVESFLFFYYKIINSLQLSLNLFYSQSEQIQKNNTYFLQYFNKNNYTFSNNFYKDFSNIFDFIKIKTIIDNLKDYLIKYYPSDLVTIENYSKIILNYNFINNIKFIIEQNIKSEDSKFQTLIDLEGVQAMIKLYNITNIMNGNIKFTKNDFISFINLFQKFGSCILNFFIVESTIKNNGERKRKDSFVLFCIYFIIIFIVNFLIFGENEDLIKKKKQKAKYD